MLVYSKSFLIGYILNKIILNVCCYINLTIFTKINVLNSSKQVSFYLDIYIKIKKLTQIIKDLMNSHLSLHLG